MSTTKATATEPHNEPPWLEQFLGESRRMMNEFLTESRRLNEDSLMESRRLNEESLMESRRLNQESLTESRRLNQESLMEARRLHEEAWERSLALSEQNRANGDRMLDLLRLDIQASRTLIRRLGVMHRAERRESREWMERFFRGREN